MQQCNITENLENVLLFETLSRVSLVVVVVVVQDVVVDDDGDDDRHFRTGPGSRYN